MSAASRASAPHPRWIAHRGWSTRFPENSLAAFAAAVAAGADELEFDLRSSADGQSLVLHDATLERTHAVGGAVADHPAAAVARIAARASDGSLLPRMGLPTLEQLLALFAGRVELNVHIKTLTPSLAELDRLADAAAAGASLYVAAGAEVLRTVVRHRPELRRCMIQLPNDRPADAVAVAADLGCERLQFFVGYFGEADVARAKERGLLTQQFFADDLPAVELALSWGIDAILTNDIGAVAEAFELSRAGHAPVAGG